MNRTIELLLSFMPRVKPDLIIYLHTTPQAAMKRIITRGRPEEEEEEEDEEEEEEEEEEEALRLIT